MTELEPQHDFPDPLDEAKRHVTPTAAEILPGENWTHPALEQLPPDDWAHRYFAAYMSPIGLAVQTRAYIHAGVSRDVFRDRKRNDGIFNVIHEAADDAIREAFEYVLHDRIMNGTIRPIYQKGRLVGFAREVDNSLLKWALERLMPDKYHLPARVELSGVHHPGDFKFAIGPPVVQGELAAGDGSAEGDPEVSGE